MLDPLLKKSIDQYWFKPVMHAVEIFSDAMIMAGVPRAGRYGWADKEYSASICKNVEDFQNNLTRGCIDHPPEIEFCLKKICLSYFSRFKHELSSDSVQSTIEYLEKKYQEISEAARQVVNRYYAEEEVDLTLRDGVKSLTATILKKFRDTCIEPAVLELKFLAKEERQKSESSLKKDPGEDGAVASCEIEKNKVRKPLEAEEIRWSKEAFSKTVIGKVAANVGYQDEKSYRDYVDKEHRDRPIIKETKAPHKWLVNMDWLCEERNKLTELDILKKLRAG